MEPYLVANRSQLLQQAITDLVPHLPGQPQIGVEIEFYLLEHPQEPVNWSPDQIETFFTTLQTALVHSNVKLYGIEEEDGEGQFEVKLPPYTNLPILVEDIAKTQECIRQIAKDFEIMADFATTPLPQDCSSSLQFNISLLDAEGHNLFASREPAEEPLLIRIVYGLLATLKESIVFFAPHKEDYQRYDIDNNRRLYSRGKQVAPINLSWGPNNRTAALRIPAITANIDLTNDRKTSWVNQLEQHIDLKLCRIEHRVPAIACNLELSLVSILMGIYLGIHKRCPVVPLLNGDAYDLINHRFVGFANTLEQAQNDFLSGKYLAPKLKKWIKQLK